MIGSICSLVTRRRACAQHGEDAVAARVVDVAVFLELCLVCGVELRDLARDRPDEPERERREPEQAQDSNEGQETELADPAPATRLRV